MMKEKKLNNGFSMPVLGLGTWLTGGRTEPDPGVDEESLVSGIRNAVHAGFRHIDTAEYYAGGYAEILVGKAVEGLDRSSLFLCSKVWKDHMEYDDVLYAAEASLKRLKTDHFDLYLIHRADTETPLKETMRAMNRLAAEKITHWIGVSNFAAPRLKLAMDMAESPIAVDQVHYSLRLRECEQELLPFCQEHDVMLEAWRPLKGIEVCSLTLQLAKKYHVTPAQLALAWLVNQNNVTAITAMRSGSHLQENIAAAELKLEPEDVLLLKEQFPNQSFRSEAVPLM